MNLTSKRMLQCLTAVAGVFAFTATAEQAWWGVKDAFENADGGTNGMPISQYQATPWQAPNEAWYTNYVWVAAETDQSQIVTNDSDRAGYGGINPITDPATNGLVLALATEGNTLTRHVIDGTSTGKTFSASAKVFVDTLIKFTPSEDTPTISNDVKMAVYVNVNSNLVVYHGMYDEGENFLKTNSVFETVPISPSQWYRLTIELGKDTTEGVAVFKVYLNDSPLKHANAIGGVDGAGNFITATPYTDYEYILNAVAFQGTGFVDELVVSDDADLGGGAAILLTLSWDAGIQSVTTNGADVLSGGTVPNGTFIVIGAKDWYNVAAVDGATFAEPGTFGNNSASGTVTAIASTNVMIVSATNTVTGSMGGNSVDPAKLSAWALAQQPALTESDVTANADAWFDEYLLNLAPDAAVTNTIAIDSIAVGATDATIKVVASSTAVDFETINGTLYIYTATNLVTGFNEQQPVEYGLNLKEQNTNTVTVPLNAGSFIKATIK